MKSMANSKNSLTKWEAFDKKISYLKSLGRGIETHMSWVILTDQFAYKIKKPINFPLLNLETLRSRYINAHLEFKLNQTLAPSYYLGVIPLRRNKDGAFYLGEISNEYVEIVDWLVKMRRFPNDLTLDQCILFKSIPIERVQVSAKSLALFYQHAASEHVGGSDFLLRLNSDIEENFSVLSSSRFHLDPLTLETLKTAQLQFLRTNRDELLERVRKKRIIQGHGDLRPEHICLTDPPIIFDRLEFSQKLRTVDPYDELSYLDLECLHLGDESIGKIYLSAYEHLVQDFISIELIHFYQSYRAVLRAKLAILHLDDERVSNKDLWMNKTLVYLHLAKIILP
jgi:aminoglycoside phosphotransferase family enzyme